MAQKTTAEASDLGQDSDLRGLLKKLRKRLDPATKTLGTHQRLSQRRGRPVSQEELAEAVGVSRGWYALLESGAAVQPSVPLLNRIADALSASSNERIQLFRLAIPALHTGLARGSSDAFASLSLLRAASGRLCFANSDSEALEIAAEYAGSWFNDALLVVSAKRNEADSWDWRVELDRGVTSNECVAPQLSDLPCIQARITGLDGFDGFIHVRHGIGHCYSEFDREVLQAVADLASLALS